MCKRNGKRHKLGSFITSISEHKALVTCTGVKLIVCFVTFCFKAFIYTHSNICALLVNRAEYSTSMSIKTILCSIVSDFCNGFSNYFLDIYFCFCCDLTHNSDNTCGSKGLASNTALGILCNHFVKNSI